MREFVVLKLLDRFQRVFEKLGVDYQIMRRILQLKFVMDGRRVPTVIGNTKKKNKKPENSFIKSLWVYAVMGIIIVFFIMTGQSYIFQMSLAFGIIMFMIMTSLISDFSAVLLDMRDKNIIATKPVNNITLNMAKTIHIVVYLFFVTMALAGPALIVSIFTQGFMFFILFLLELILVDIFVITLTALLYILILRFFDGEKLKDVINYVQIGLTITITVGYQLVGRLFAFVDADIIFYPKWWQYFIVPIWFGGPFEVLLNGSKNIYYIVFSILAFIIPIFSIIAYIHFMPAFERNLQKLNNNDTKGKENKGKFLRGISRIICATKEEMLFFHFASRMMKNEREFKLKVYPSLGFAFIFPFIFIINGLRDNGLEGIASSNMYFYIYFCTFFLPTAVVMMRYSSNYKGAWLYKVVPIGKLAPVFKGTLKAFLVNLLMPVYIFESVIFIWIFGFRILPDLIAVIINISIYIVICFKIIQKDLPFSKPFNITQEGNSWSLIPVMLLLGVLAGIHFLFKFMSFGIYIYILLALLASIILWKKGFDITWETANK